MKIRDLKWLTSLRSHSRAPFCSTHHKQANTRQMLMYVSASVSTKHHTHLPVCVCVCVTLSFHALCPFRRLRRTQVAAQAGPDIQQRSTLNFTFFLVLPPRLCTLIYPPYFYSHLSSLLSYSKKKTPVSLLFLPLLRFSLPIPLVSDTFCTSSV